MPEKSEGQRQSNEKPESNGDVRIAVYVCQCGGNIGDVINCDRAAQMLGKLPDVVVSRTNMAMCSDAGQAIIEEDIREHGANRVVIGACAPSLHEQTFRGTVTRAGLNPYLYLHVGLREQDSWVSKNDRAGAFEKCLRLMAAGVAKARLLKPLEPIRLTAEKHALVIGGGVAGLHTAWDIARCGIQVTLIEKTPFLGGRTAQLETVFPDGQPARTMLHGLIEKVMAHPSITVMTGAELVKVSGYVGDYQVQIRQHSRGVTDDNGDAAIAACTDTIPDPYNYGLTKRKLVYRAYPGCYPATPAVDWDNCLDGRLELEIDGKHLVLEDKPRTIDLKVGAVAIATGFRPYQPPTGEYGFDELTEVITLPKLIRLLALTEKGQKLTWNGRTVRNIAMIHCVGSRQVDGIQEPQPDGEVNNYCSRVCCTATLHVATELRERFPAINIFDLYEDIRTYGRGHEAYYTEASAQQVRFLRFHDDEIPTVERAPEDDPYPVLVKVKDYLTWGEEIEIPVDLVVLAVGMMPNPTEDLVNLLKVFPGTDRFLLEVHPKLRPVETAVPGVVLAGTAQGPMNIQESCAAASAAAAKVAGLLGQGQVELEPFVAWVNPDLCTGSGECIEVCCYEDAISLQTVASNGKKVQQAVVTPANCTGCGACVSACPNRALDVQGWELAQYEAMVSAVVADPLLEEV
jgi:heterodisulfide reductase subunit A